MALKRIKIVVDSPILPEGQEITHSATSFQIGSDKDLNNKDNILAEKLKETKDKLVVYFDLDIDYNVIIYARCKYHFDSDGVALESEWSRVVPINSLQTGIKLSSSIVKTPTVTVEEENDLLYIKTSDFDMYTGPGAHHSTDYRITDTDGVTVYTRDNDQDNLTSIYLEDKLENGKIYIAEARHTNTTNNTSYYGKKLYLNYSPDLNLFSFDAPEEFVINRKFYYRIKIWVAKFESYDLEIRDQDGNAIIKLEKEQRLVNYIMLTNDKLVQYLPYTIYVRFNFTDGTITEYKQVYTATLLNNSIYSYDATCIYTDKYQLGKYKELGGITCATTRETFDYKVILPDFTSNSLNLYTQDGTELKPVGKVYEFDQGLDIDYVNIVQLANHDVLVDIVVYNSRKQAHSMFLLFEYDPIKINFTLVKQKIRYDERYTTSMSNSIVVTPDNTIYYVPAYLTDGTNDDRIWLTLRKLDPSTLEIEDIKLPFDCKYFVNVVQDQYGEVYVLGGSQYSRWMDNADGTKTEYWRVDNRDVYKLNKETNTFTIWSALPEYFPDTLYNVQPVMRKDGRNILFNATVSGASLNYDKFITFDAALKTFNVTDVNGEVAVPVRTNIIFKSGDVYRYTSKVEDPQYLLIYNSNTAKAEEIPTFTDISKEPMELNVGTDEVVVIEDIYKYTKITIVDNGVVKWYRPQGITTLTSKDLIIYKDTIITEEELTSAKYRSVLVLDGVDFQIRRV